MPKGANSSILGGLGWNELIVIINTHNPDNLFRFSTRVRDFSYRLFEGEWWNADWPLMPNHDYVYLCRILDTVKEVLNSQEKPTETVNLPKELTYENGAKSLLRGEFFESYEVMNHDYCGEDCEICGRDDECSVDDPCREYSFNQKVPVSWTNIKEIYKKIVKHYQEK